MTGPQAQPARPSPAPVVPWRDALITAFDSAGDRIADTVARALRARGRTVERPAVQGVDAVIAAPETALLVADVTRGHPAVLAQLAAARQRGLPTVVLADVAARQHVPAGDDRQQVVFYEAADLGALAERVGELQL